jgi:hypothetical protein
MPNLQKYQNLPRIIPQEVMLAVLNRCDDTREFMLEMWRNNSRLAMQGRSKVAILLGQQPPVEGWIYEPSPKV